MVFSSFVLSSPRLAALYLFQEASSATGTPIWVPIIIVVVVILLFVWGYFNSTGIERPAAETAVPAADHPEPEPAVATETAVADELQRIEGIGPKIEGVLHQAGIKTFAQLAATEVARLEQIVREEAGIRVAFPDTWPEQARLAAEGEWDQLAHLQDELKGGRRAE